MKKKFLHKKKSWREFLHGSLLGVFLFITFITSSTQAQWKKIAQFPIITQGWNIGLDVYFKEFSSVPLDGFISIDDNGPPAHKLWRTLDGGKTWHEITAINGGPGLVGVFPRCFTFKNSMEGWFGGGDDTGFYKTTDGGDSWIISIPYPDTWEIFYVPLTDKVILTGGTNGGAGIAFSDSIHGIITANNGANGLNTLKYTTDAGLTWQSTNELNEQYQPIGIEGTLTFYTLRELAKNGDPAPIAALDRSDDGGMTWRKTYQYHNNTDYESVTGTLQYNKFGIYFQTVPDTSEGIMMSEDGGYTFHSICGPTNAADTRFYVRDTFMYAGDAYGGLWLNTTGIGSNSTPQLVYDKLEIPQAILGCKQIDSAITFTFFDSCANTQAKLDTAFISGSANFSFSSPSVIPRRIHPGDSLVISYNPVSAKLDTAQLHLRFHLGWKDFDTVVQLFGAGRIPKETVRLVPSSASYASVAGNTVDVSYLPNKNITSRGLNSISFDLTFNGDLLDYMGVPNTNPLITVTTGTPTFASGIETLPVRITGNNISLDSLQAIVTLKFRAMVTRTMQTNITMSNIQLNGGDQNFTNCILSADTTSCSFTLIAQCGDSTQSSFLKGIIPMKIISIRPNPAQDEIELDLQSPVEQASTIEIFDALGVRVLSDMKHISKGTNAIHVDTRNLSGGMYLVRINAVSGSVSGSFVKVK
jgi:hypothetical protein